MTVEEKKELFLRERIYKLATDLYLKNITVKEFEEKLENSHFTADKLYGSK